MKKLSIGILACALAISTQAQGIIDDFSGDLSAYTATRILKASAGAADNVYAWEIGSGSLQLVTTTYGGIEQYALTRTDYTLGVGLELKADYIPSNLNSQDIGLYVGAGHPTADVRQDYLSLYIRNNGQVFSRGFNGTSELGLAGGTTPSDLASLFVTRTALDTYELGWYSTTGVRNVITTRTMGNSAIGDAVGFYADIRGAGTRGNLDNLTIPEPSTLALAGLGVAGLLIFRRR